MKKILFLTINNLTTNPRLLKEIRLAQTRYTCTVYAFRLNNWSDALDEQLKSSNDNTSYKYINAGRESFFNWLVSSAIHYLSGTLYKFFKRSFVVNAYGHSKRSWLLQQQLKRTSEKYDLVIAHNLGALYPAYRLSRRLDIPFAFDIEDYHPGEIMENDAANETERRIFLLKKILPKAVFLSYASPLIGEYTMKLLPAPNTVKALFIPNSFPGKEFLQPFKKNDGERLKLVWFSQYITTDRGLEEIILAAQPFRDQLEIHLIGYLKPALAACLAGLDDFIFIHAPLNQSELHNELSGYDIGLALEISHIDINKDIAVSNKIYAYAQAGLMILATDTSGQRWFIEQYPWSGVLSEQTVTALQKKIDYLIVEKEKIRLTAADRFEKGQMLAWEKMSPQMLSLWNLNEN